MTMTNTHIWERFARDHPEAYITTEIPLERFFESGREEAREILESVDGWLARREIAVEIGCGVGRITIPMAPEFTSVLAVDIAPTMLAKLKENCERFGVTNVAVSLAHEQWHADLEVDLAYSRLVFQHIEDLHEIDDYLRRVAACLGPASVGCLQFDTRPRTLPYRVRNALPDRALPPDWRRGIRRIRRSPRTLASMLARRGLVVVDELRPDTKDHVFLVQRA